MWATHICTDKIGLYCIISESIENFPKICKKNLLLCSAKYYASFLTCSTIHIWISLSLSLSLSILVYIYNFILICFNYYLLRYLEKQSTFLCLLVGNLGWPCLCLAWFTHSVQQILLWLVLLETLMFLNSLPYLIHTLCKTVLLYSHTGQRNRQSVTHTTQPQMTVRQWLQVHLQVRRHVLPTSDTQL